MQQQVPVNDGGLIQPWEKEILQQLHARHRCDEARGDGLFLEPRKEFMLRDYRYVRTTGEYGRWTFRQQEHRAVIKCMQCQAEIKVKLIYAYSEKTNYADCQIIEPKPQKKPKTNKKGAETKC